MSRRSLRIGFVFGIALIGGVSLGMEVPADAAGFTTAARTEDGVIGVALMVGSDQSEGYPVVSQLIPDGSAAEDGHIKVGDRVIGVDVEDGKRIDFQGKELMEVVRLIRGPADTKVKLVVIHAGENEKKVYELTRKPLKVE